MTGKTVITYLIDGDPSGPQYRFIDKKGDTRMYIIPRTKLDVITDFPELDAPALYMLIGDTEDSKPKAYIGQAENFKIRIKQHHIGTKAKDFWQKVIVFVSPSKSINKADVEYLEHLAIKMAKEVNSYETDENKNVPSAPHLPLHQKAPMDEFFEQVKFLTAFYGCRLFAENERICLHIFSLKGKCCSAMGFYGDDGFTVLSGSVVEGTLTKTFRSVNKRNELLNSYAKKLDDNRFRLVSDFPPLSPSAAASICLGRSANGWIEWKDEQGRTLNDVYRK